MHIEPTPVLGVVGGLAPEGLGLPPGFNKGWVTPLPEVGKEEFACRPFGLGLSEYSYLFSFGRPGEDSSSTLTAPGEKIMSDALATGPENG